MSWFVVLFCFCYIQGLEGMFTKQYDKCSWSLVRKKRSHWFSSRHLGRFQKDGEFWSDLKSASDDSSLYEPCCLTQSLQQKLQTVIGFSKTCNIFFKNACYLRCSVKKYDQWETCHPDTEQFKLRPFIAESFNSKSSRNLLLSKPLLRNILQLITCEF